MARFLTFLCVAVAVSGCGPAETMTAQRGDPLVTDMDQRSWSGRGFTGTQLLTEHYRIYSTASNRAIQQYLPGFLESAYRNYLRLTGLPGGEPSQRMPVYVMGTRDEWALLTKSVVPHHQVNTYLSIRSGGYCYEGTCAFWDLGGLHTFPVASHEGLHQFFAYRLRHPLPLWLEEGLCTLAEGHDVNGETVVFRADRNLDRFQSLRRALVSGDWIPLRQLLGMHAGDAVGHAPGKAVGYYAQLWALARFIRSEPTYRQGLEKLLADADAGRLHTALEMDQAALERLAETRGLYNRRLSEPIFRRYICEDVEGFERQYYAFAKSLAKLD
jgi:hypothetical protein